MRKVSMTARDELVNALARRYAVAGRAEKTRILDEFVAITGFHRKHGMRLLRCDAAARRSEGKASRRIYDEAVCEAIVVLWEASDRICGKRLNEGLPINMARIMGERSTYRAQDCDSNTSPSRNRMTHDLAIAPENVDPSYRRHSHPSPRYTSTTSAICT